MYIIFYWCCTNCQSDDMWNNEYMSWILISTRKKIMINDLWFTNKSVPVRIVLSPVATSYNFYNEIKMILLFKYEPQDNICDL